MRVSALFTRAVPCGFCTLVAATSLLHASSAQADWRLHFDGAVERPLGGPQMREFGLGGAAQLRLEWRASRYLGLIASAGTMVLPGDLNQLPQGFAQPAVGVLNTAMLGAHFGLIHWGAGHDVDGLWVEIAGGAGVTGSRIAPVLAARAGISFPIGPIALGPFVEFVQVFDLEDSVLAGNAQLGVAGLSVAIRVDRPREIPPPPPPTTDCVTHPESPVCRPAVPIIVPREGDRDGDHVLDGDDQCPDVPEDLDGFEDSDGCPELDNDRDGIEDHVDACPLSPETINGQDDLDGCPDDLVASTIHATQGAAETILFAFDSAAIEGEDIHRLQSLATWIMQHPELGSIYVEGHADEVGAAQYNFELSLSRARAVVRLLVSFGVSPERIVPLGFGCNEPLDTSALQDSDDVNRRVEITTGTPLSTGRARTATGWTTVTREDRAE